jgi:hypothetical protein
LRSFGIASSGFPRRAATPIYVARSAQVATSQQLQIVSVFQKTRGATSRSSCTETYGADRSW